MASQDQAVKLLGAWFSPFAHRVEVALKLKGIPYEFVEEDLANKSPLLLKYNSIYKRIPRIPVLVQNERPIVESQLILEYIDETWKHSPLLLPQDPYQKAMARFWANFIDDKLTEAVRRVIATEGEAQQKEVKQAIEAFEVLEREIKGKKFFGGETVGFVDIVLGWITIWLEVVEETTCVKIYNP
ncbi:glutathione S-transferase U8, partial [Jatropha curcas]|uniref:glutathione S-transferase U8 n=1 Tax=Jatropha curcas TaxID=180498 RepID=UPI0018936118